MRFQYLTADFFMTENSWDEIEFFKPEEFACPCPKHAGKPVYDMHGQLILKLDNARKVLEKPIIITSGCRCKEHNAKIGGTKNSYHIQRRACDITIPDVDFDKLKELYVVCEMIGFQGIGFYPEQKFIHVDMGLRIQRWVKRSGIYIYLLLPSHK